MSTHRAYIIDAADGTDVEVDVEDDLSVDTLLDVEDQWAPARTEMRNKLRLANIPRPDWPQSLHWDWGRKSLQLTLHRGSAESRIMAIRRQAAWEAAMVTLCGAHSALLPPHSGQPLVYVDYLEVAPWNWTVDTIGQIRKYKAVGPILVLLAKEQSYAKGWDGKVGLHALPQATDFYQSQGFVFVKNDPDKQNLPYFELSAAEAIKRKGRR